MLSNEGYHVVTTTTFEDASAGLALTKPDAIIADIRLGAYNGLHLIYTSSCAILPKMFDSEGWPEPLGPLVLNNIRFLPDSNTMSCN